MISRSNNDVQQCGSPGEGTSLPARCITTRGSRCIYIYIYIYMSFNLSLSIYIYIYTAGQVYYHAGQQISAGVRAAPRPLGISRIRFSPFYGSFRDSSRNLWSNDICAFISSNWGPLAVSLKQCPWNPLGPRTPRWSMPAAPGPIWELSSQFLSMEGLFGHSR